MNVIEIIQILPKYIQALHTDGLLYFSGEKTIATANRKAIVLNDIELIKTQLDILEKTVIGIDSE